ncbi:protein TANC1-like isoform X2 [Symsagittifera roscoffensis]
MGDRQADWKIGWFIWSGAKEGNLKVIRDMVDEGADVNYKYNGTTPLHQACMNGHLEAVEFLCEFGASLSRKDAHGDTAVRHAAAFGHLHILQFLTQKGAELGNVNIAGDSALHGACAYCQPATALFLLDRGAQCNLLNKEGNTPLHKTMVFSSWFVPEHRRLATVELLLDRGADLWLINHNGLTPRQMATEKNMPLSMLQKMADIEHSQLNESKMSVMKDRLECPVCLERYRVPRTLPQCGHTYCHKCLNTMLKASIKHKQLQEQQQQLNQQQPRQQQQDHQKDIVIGYELKCPECRCDYQLMEKSVNIFPISRPHVQAVSFYCCPHPSKPPSALHPSTTSRK